MISQVEQPDRLNALFALRQFVTDRALPLWSSAGWDDANGGFVERFLPDGSPDLDSERRTFVQARQIWCFAKAAQFDWHPRARSIALEGASHLLTRIRSDASDEGFPHVTDTACKVIDARRDTSDHAAILLALAGVFELTRDAQIRSEIDAVLLLIDRRLRSGNGGLNEAIPPVMPRRLSTHMHMFEAMTALYDATGEPVFQQRAGEFFGLFMANFLDTASGTLGEYYEDDWANIQPVRIVPGHLAQWVWLLRGFERTTGCPTARHRTTLMQTLQRYLDADTGLLIDQSDREGASINPTHSLSTHASFIRALIAQAEADEAGAADEARAAIGVLISRYLQHPLSGGWYSVIGMENSPAANIVRAGELYEIVSVLSEAEQVLTAA